MCHQQLEAAICHIQKKYWLPQARQILHDGFPSAMFPKAKPVALLMGSLSEDRVTAFQSPFSFTGLDYFGPVQVMIGRRVEKRWVALFICLSVRVVQLTCDFSKDACIFAIRNYTNRP